MATDTDQPTYLVTGAQGMLGSAVVARLCEAGLPCHGTDLPEADLTDRDAVDALFGRVRPTRVLHCAAYTNVDGAESDAEICRAVNVDATRNVAEACAQAEALMQCVSTDFVFGGDAGEPYQPDDPVAPRGVYATTKLEGERAVARALSNHQIVRTAWLFGPNGKHFVSAILSRLREGLPLRVVADQTGCPTYTLDLANRLVALSQTSATGTFHLVNSGQCTWHAFAQRIAEIAGFDPDAIAAIATEDWPSPAPRPKWSVLDCSATHALGIEPMRPWHEALEAYLNLILETT